MNQLFVTPAMPSRRPPRPTSVQLDAVIATPSRQDRRLHGTPASARFDTPALRPPRLDAVRPTAMRSKHTGPPLTPSTKPARAKITSTIFCASIQNRPEWAPVVPLLLASQTEPGWEMARLSSHDLAVRISPVDTMATDSDRHRSSDVFRFLLVAPGDIGQPETARKLQRLATQKTELGATILFLLPRGNGEKLGSSMAAYKQIQMDLRETGLIILPLTAVEMLPATIAAFCSQFTVLTTVELDNSRSRLYNLLRTYFGRPTPLSAEGASKLVAACEAAKGTSTGGHTITLKDVITFSTDLIETSPLRLGRIIGAEDALRVADSWRIP